MIRSCSNSFEFQTCFQLCLIWSMVILNNRGPRWSIMAPLEKVVPSFRRGQVWVRTLLSTESACLRFKNYDVNVIIHYSINSFIPGKENAGVFFKQTSSAYQIQKKRADFETKDYHISKKSVLIIETYI